MNFVIYKNRKYKVREKNGNLYIYVNKKPRLLQTCSSYKLIGGNNNNQIIGQGCYGEVIISEDINIIIKNFYDSSDCYQENAHNKMITKIENNTNNAIGIYTFVKSSKENCENKKIKYNRCFGKNLQDILDNENLTIDQEIIIYKKVVECVLSVLSVLHQNNIVHGDVHAGNIMLCKNNNNNNNSLNTDYTHHNCKMIDFGNTRKICTNNKIRQECRRVHALFTKESYSENL
jgi:serine/threonine protein kinase